MPKKKKKPDNSNKKHDDKNNIQSMFHFGCRRVVDGSIGG
jgi:hypothetical protein